MGQQTSISLAYIVSICGSIIGLLLGIGGILVKVLYSNLIKRLDDLHTDLKPLLSRVDRLESDMINLKEDHKELKDYVYEQAKWTGQHSTDIQAINRVLKQQ
jgi:uncharacterized protein (UPF0335 family)